MKKLILSITLLLCFTAQADILCVKNKVRVNNNSVQLANNVKLIEGTTCPARHTLIKDLNTIKDQQLVSFAKIDGTGLVKNYGGSKTTSLSVTQPFPGRFEVTFFGNFDLPTPENSEQNRNLLTVNSSAVASVYGVTNNGVLTASQTEITITVFLWNSATTMDENQAGINLSVMQGEAPLI